MVARDASRLLSNSNPDVMFTYFGDVDVVGHEEGFHPKIWKYIHRIEKTDEYIGSILDSLKSRFTYDHEDWLIICTTDHGGTKHGHFGSDYANFRAFYIMNGKSLDRCIIPQRPALVDIAPTIYNYLGLFDPTWNLDGQPVGFRSGKCFS